MSARKVLIVIVVPYAQNRKNLFIFPLVVDRRATWTTFQPKLKKQKIKIEKIINSEKIFYILSKKSFSYVSGKLNSYIFVN